jgi:hypothetical protein
MAITPSQPSAGKGRQIADFMKGATDKALKKRMEGGQKVEQQRARAAKPTRKQQRKRAEKSADRRGKNIDVRA